MTEINNLIDRTKLKALVRKVTGADPECVMCFGKCRTHNLGDSSEWDAEFGSEAWVGEVEARDQNLINQLAGTEKSLEDAQKRREALLLALKEIREISQVGNAKPNAAGIMAMADKLDRVAKIAKAAIVEEGRPGLR